MRRELAWALGASVALSSWVLLNPASKNSPIIQPSARVGDSLQAPGKDSPSDAHAASIDLAPSRTGAVVATTVAALPATWPAPRMEPAERSPFDSPLPPAAKPQPVPAPPPPSQTVPVVTYRYWGSLTSPSGERLVYVVRPDNGSPIAVQAGTRLEGGYEVEQVTAASIVLSQAPTQQHVTLSLSPPTSGGVR